MSTPVPPAARQPRRFSRRLAAVLVVLVLIIVGMVARFAASVDALVHRRAVGPSWSFPSVVYSADVPLGGGRAISREYLRLQLAARDYRAVTGRPDAPGEFRETDDGFELVVRGFLEAPDPAGHGGPEHIRFTIRNGTLGGLKRLGGLRGYPRPDSTSLPRLEPTPFAWLTEDDPVRRSWVPLSRIPRVLQDAVIVSEDRRFRSHPGYDVRGGFRAMFANFRSGSVRQGGSTITQQLARGLFLGRERRLSRKLNELGLAVGLEILLSKDRILEMYLNSVYLGQREGLGIAGVAEGARAFFGVPVDSLTLDQAALLVCIIPAPNAFSPWRDPERIRRRRDRLLDDMAATRVITPAAADAAKERPVAVSQTPPRPDRFPSAVDRVRDELRRTVSGEALSGHGYIVFTHIDPVWQSIAENSVAETVDRIDRSRRGEEPLQGALVMMEARTGAIKALVGSRDPVPGAYDYALDSKRQPGSAAKPFVYAAALANEHGGAHLTPASTVPDLPRTFRAGGKTWQPRNHDGRYHGRISLAMALARSQNLATINLVELVRAPHVAKTFERFGLGRPAPVLSMGLGTEDVNLLDLTAAYAAFPAEGMRPAPVAVRRVFDAAGHDHTPERREPERAIDEVTAAEMIGMLTNVIEIGTGRSLRWQYNFQRPCAGKTGTTNDERDAWFMGFTPDLVCGVWVGFPTPRRIGRAGAGAALPIWGRLMSQALDGFPALEFPKRADLETRWIDAYTGGTARDDCPGRIRVPWRLADALPPLCTSDHTRDWEAIRERALRDSVARATADSAAAVSLTAPRPDSAVSR